MSTCAVHLKITVRTNKINLISFFFLPSLPRCTQGDVVTHTAWLNRSSILYAGEEKWSVDPRVSLVTLNQEEFTIKIENVDMTDEGQYVCAVQTSSRPRTTVVHILVQGNTHTHTTYPDNSANIATPAAAATYQYTVIFTTRIKGRLSPLLSIHVLSVSCIYRCKTAYFLYSRDVKLPSFLPLFFCFPSPFTLSFLPPPFPPFHLSFLSCFLYSVPPFSVSCSLSSLHLFHTQWQLIVFYMKPEH